MVAIETATETVGVAVRTAAGVEAELTLTGRRRHVETLTPALEHLLAQVGLVPADLGVVAVDIGPGLFTGLRVGRGRGQGSGPVARHRGGRGDQPRHPDGGRRRGRAAAAWCWPASTPAGARCSPPCTRSDAAGPCPAVRLAAGLFAPEDLAAALGGVRRRAGARRGRRRAALRRRAAGGPRRRCGGAGPGLPAAGRAARPGRARLDAGEPPVEPAAVVPLYMREADAKSNFARAVRA